MAGRITAHFSRKRSRRSEEGDEDSSGTPTPDPLWSSALVTVFRHLQGEHAEKLIHDMARDAQLRQLMIEELLHKPQLPDLRDDDLIEIEQVHNSQLERTTIRLATVPFRLREALRVHFKVVASEHFKRHTKWSAWHGFVGNDGRIEFNITEGHTEWDVLWDQYYWMLDAKIKSEGIPDWEDVGSKWDPVDLNGLNLAHGLQPDTLEWDAYDLSVNDVEHTLMETFFKECETFFYCKVPEDPVYKGETVGAVWCRKPRVRFVVALDNA